MTDFELKAKKTNLKSLIKTNIFSEVHKADWTKNLDQVQQSVQFKHPVLTHSAFFSKYWPTRLYLSKYWHTLLNF